MSNEMIEQLAERRKAGLNGRTTGEETVLLEKAVMQTNYGGLTMRPARMEDLEDAVRLFDECAVAMTGQPDTDIEDIRSEWLLPDFDLAKSTRVVTTPDDRLVGYIEVWDTGSLPVKVWVWARVHPHYQDLGIGTGLMNWAEGRAREALERVDPELRVVMESGTYRQNEGAKQLFLNHGMEPIRRFLTMAVDLPDEPIAAEWPPGIKVRTATGIDELATVLRAVRDAFQDHWGYVEDPFEEEYERWLHFIENSNDFDPSLWFLAMDGDEIAGMSLCWPKSHRDPNMGWVGTLGVRRPWRRQGLGLALLKHSFGVFQERGQKKVGLGVDSQSLTGATRLYERAGMRSILAFEVYQKELRPGKDVATRALAEQT